MKLYQTAPSTVPDVELSSVADALRMQTWNRKSWQTVADIAKPPLWEIDNFGEAFVFKPSQPFSSTSRLQRDFRGASFFNASSTESYSGSSREGRLRPPNSLSQPGFNLFWAAMAHQDLPFVASATALVFVAMMWALSLCISHRAWVCKKIKARLASLALLFGRRTAGDVTDEERKYIDEKILEEKTELARKIIFVLLYFGVGNLMNILYNILMDHPLWLSSSGCWIVVIAVLLMLLAQVPGMLSTRTVDLWSAILQLIVLAFLSELATSAHETLMLGSGLFVTICVPAAAFANRRSVLLFCQLSFLLHAVVRAFRDFEEFQRATQCNALNGAQTFVMAHLVFLPLALTVSMWAHQLMEHRVESRFRESKSQTQLSAASALLDLTCDAVFQLDADLRLLSHSGSLAALLMRNRAGATLKGGRFRWCG
eukprot:s246_g13.t1